jgi:hypothetical protein
VFYIKAGTSDSFPIATLVQLAEVFELSRVSWSKGVARTILEHKGALPELIVSPILNCLKKLKDDIAKVMPDDLSLISSGYRASSDELFTSSFKLSP